MADEEQQKPESSLSESEDRHRLKITPEQRRVLGPARSRQDWAAAEEKPKIAPTPPRAVPEAATERAEREAEPETTTGRRQPMEGKLSHVLQMQNVVLLFGGFLLLIAVFYVGKKFDYWRYVLFARNKIELSPGTANKFPNASAEELIAQALASERVGDWHDAAERLIAAKYKNLSYRGVLFRVGKLYYDHGDFESADRLFESAIAFGEDVEKALYYRGMIANGRGQYATAEHFYESATSVAPFNADYFYSWAETLRRDHRPKDAIARYEQAASRAGEAEANVCRFKMKMAAIEAGDLVSISSDLEKKQSAGPLNTDWMMTAAALKIQTGQLEDAIRMIKDARIADPSLLNGQFAAFAGDRFFANASRSNPELADACRVQTTAR